MRFIWLSIVAAFSLLIAAPSFADESKPLALGGDILSAAKVRPLNRGIDDVIRFSSAPALGGRGYVVELRKSSKATTGRLILLYGHPRMGWRIRGEVPLEITPADFDVLANATQRFDRQAPSEVGQDEVVVCTDGPGYLTELRLAGRLRQLSGFCGDHANNRIAMFVGRVAQASLETWLGDTTGAAAEGPCGPDEVVGDLVIAELKATLGQDISGWDVDRRAIHWQGAMLRITVPRRDARGVVNPSNFTIYAETCSGPVVRSGLEAWGVLD